MKQGIRNRNLSGLILQPSCFNFQISGFRDAFSLVEVSLALGITAFCLVTLFGLLPVGLTSNQNAIEQTAAAGVATGILSDLRVTPSTSGTSARYGIGIPSSGTVTHTLFLRDDGTGAGDQDADVDPSKNPRYRATIVFTVPPAKTSYFGTASLSATEGKAIFVRLILTWPALADMKAAKAPVNYSGSFEIVSALDRD